MGGRSVNGKSFTAGWLDAGILLVLWGILLRIQNPGLMADDSGEMVAAAVGLGIPHPPGYPWVVLLGHIMNWLPVGTPAFRMNLLSEGLLLAAVWVSFPLLNSLRGKEPSLASAFRDRIFFVLLLFSIHAFVAQALTAKGVVYALNLFLVCLLMRVGSSDRSGTGTVGATMFLWAIGMANHWQTMVLWSPLVVWNWGRWGKWPGLRILLVGSVLGIVGLSVYLLLPLRAIQDCVPSWGYPVHPSLFYWVLSRKLVSQVEHWVQPFDFYSKSFLEMVRFFARGVFPLLVPMGVVGIGWLFYKRKTWFWKTLLWAGPVLMGVLLIHEDQNTYLVPVYLVSISVALALLAVVGLRCFEDRVKEKRGILFFFLGMGLALLVWDGSVLRAEDKMGYLLASDFGVNVLQDLPRGSVLLAEGDPYVMSVWYQRIAEKRREDVIFEPAVFLVHGWGWKQLADQSPGIAALVRRTSVFQERLQGLADLGAAHPFCYSLGRWKMGGALLEMPGAWRSLGLITTQATATKNKFLSSGENSYRIRVTDPIPMDTASLGILAYYRLAAGSARP
ncbi:MAG TPA: DUF2723 domain-containing protein [bacterium]|nr:DUF2723 domain-containing protein [bacterium]